MCLLSKNKIPAIALQDLQAFKVVKINDSQHWIAPYVGSIHKYNEILENEISNTKHYIHCFGDEYIIGEGYFHAVTRKIEAFNILSYVISLHETACFKIVPVTIPKGSLYYLDSETSDICSNKIIVHYGEI